MGKSKRKRTASRRRVPRARGQPTATSIVGALFSSTQQRVLGLLFGQPERLFTVSELIRLAGIGSGAVQRELRRLAASGLVETTVHEGRKKYRANRAAPIFSELRSIIEKTVGVSGQLRLALQTLGDRVRLAILFGSVAKGTDRAESDIDVLIVSDDLILEDAYRLLAPVEVRLGRKINPTLYTSKEFASRRRAMHPFLTKILAGPRVLLMGAEDALEATR